MSKETGFDDLPLELQEYIFSFVPTDNWINTGKVSKKWLNLTLSTFKEIKPCHMDAVNDLAEFINEHRKTSYDEVSLLTLMPRLEKLALIENHRNVYRKLIPVLPKLKVLRIHARIKRMIDFKKLNVYFDSLIEFSFEGFDDTIFPLSIFEVAPKLEILTIRGISVTKEWQKKIPETVKQFTIKYGCLNWRPIVDLSLFEFFFKNPSTLEKLEFRGKLSRFRLHLDDFSMVPNLKILTIDVGGLNSAIYLRKAFQTCSRLEKVETYVMHVNKDWHKVIPANVLSLSVEVLNVSDELQEDFCIEYLFQNFDSLQELDIKQFNCSALNPDKFRCGKALRKLHLGKFFTIGQ